MVVVRLRRLGLQCEPRGGRRQPDLLAGGVSGGWDGVRPFRGVGGRAKNLHKPDLPKRKHTALHKGVSGSGFCAPIKADSGGGLERRAMVQSSESGRVWDSGLLRAMKEGYVFFVVAVRLGFVCLCVEIGLAGWGSRRNEGNV